MEEQMNAETEIYILKKHQQALTLEQEISEVICLAQGDNPPPTSTENISSKDDLSALIYSARKSNARVYVDSIVKKLHYSILRLL